MAEIRASEPQPLSSFTESVNNGYARLLGVLGEKAIVWRGELLNIHRITHCFFKTISNMAPGTLIVFRHKFEAFTGIDYRCFFKDFYPQKLQAQVVLENFLTSDSLSFKPGARYFFGHLIS